MDATILTECLHSCKYLIDATTLTECLHSCKYLIDATTLTECLHSCKYLTDATTLTECLHSCKYLIDATTLTECLHSFCRSCLVRYLHTSQHCPKCDTLVHKTRPLLNASSSQSARSPGNLGVDRVLQNIVYKLVPGLFKDEMKKRRDFYTRNPQAGTSSGNSPVDLEARGEVSEEALVIYSDDEHMNLSLEYYVPYRRKVLEEKNHGDKEKNKKRTNDDDSMNDDDIVHKRYLRCPAAVCVKHIKKFIRNKFDLKPNYEIEITHMDNEDDSLPDDYTLMDVAYIYTWRRNGPLPLVFRVFQEANKRQKTKHATKSISTDLQPFPVESGQTTTEPKLLPSDPVPTGPVQTLLPTTVPTPTGPVTTDPAPAEDSDRLPAQSSVEHEQASDAETSKPASPKSLDTEKEKSHESESNHGCDDPKKTNVSDSLPDFMIVNKDEQNSNTVISQQQDTQNGDEGKDAIEKEKNKLELINNNDKPEKVKENKQNTNGISKHLQSDMPSLDAPPTLSAPVSVR
ncbi:uncharacterized protein [Apostichopus japonicus]|uniref:uncharacterized protein isoform X1 n=1 Tax=Stichopus japonicus TaxID=307972 RepID=UPI003AB3490F